jgi:hypothetical protein
MSEWYVVVEGQARGPVSNETVLAYLKTRNRAEVRVWREGFDGWRLADDVAELRAALPPLPLVAIRDPGPRPDVTESARKSRKLRWFIIGATVGFLYSLVALAADRPAATTVFYLLSYILGGTGLAGLVGFIAGVIGDVFGQKTKPETIQTPTVSTAETVRVTRGRNFIARHWRGELPLWMSYWVIGILVNPCAIVVPVFIAAAFESKSGYYPLSLFATFTTSWACLLALACWQLVGTWRSAQRYKAARHQLGRSELWGDLAQLAVMFGVLSCTISILNNGAPQIMETWRIAFQNDPDIPDYSIRVMRNGTEAEIVGGLKYGLADDFAKVLNASRQIKVVHLDSVGGRLGEGEKLYELISSRGLDTYVSSQCMSACTMAFAGGRERYLREGAALGFHKGAFPGANDGRLDQVQKAVFVRAGFDAGFITKALSTPSSEMYQPESSELLSAHVITAVTDGTRFALSGMGPNVSKDVFAASLAKAQPLFGTMKERFPDFYESFIDDYYQNLMQGKSEAETIATTREKLQSFLIPLLPLADDAVLVDYAKILSEQYDALKKIDVEACYQHASSIEKGDVSSLFPANISAREWALQERVVRTASERANVDPKQKATLSAQVFRRLGIKGLTRSDLEIMVAKSVDPSMYEQYCANNIYLLREISQLPARDGALLMRSILLEK